MGDYIGIKDVKDICNGNYNITKNIGNEKLTRSNLQKLFALVDQRLIGF